MTIKAVRTATITWLNTILEAGIGNVIHERESIRVFNFTDRRSLLGQLRKSKHDHSHSRIAPEVLVPAPEVRRGRRIADLRS